MTVAQLTASRALWRSREVSRYKKWHFYKFSSKRPAAERLKLRQKWWDSYVEARDKRVGRDRDIAKARANPHEVSAAGVALVAEFEGFVDHVYLDAVGVPTIGYGETNPVTIAKWRGKTMPKPVAQGYLVTRLNRDYLPAVLAAGKGKLNQNQVDAFTSFVYNVGTGGVSEQTGVGKALRAGKVRAAADGLLAWCKAGGRVLEGLLRRRKTERELALK